MMPGSLADNGPSCSDGEGGVVVRRMCQDEACPYTGFCDKTCGYCGDGKSPPVHAILFVRYVGGTGLELTPRGAYRWPLSRRAER